MQPGSPAHDRQLMAWSDQLDRLSASVRQPVPTCEGCRLFVPDPINPPDGLGDCAKGHGSHYPSAPHWCKQHEAMPA